MTNPRLVEHRVKGLRDIRAIMNSMKTLAYLESQKLSRIVPAQHAVTKQLDIVAADLLTHHPQVLPSGRPARQAWIVLGTERGFCGSFNQQLVERLSDETGKPLSEGAYVLLVGHKLHMAFHTVENPQTILIEGAGVAEEVPLILNRVIDELESLRSRIGPVSVSAICYDSDGRLGIRKLLPPFRDFPTNIDRQSHDPQLNLQPERLLLDLTDQYLFSTLFEMLYGSLLMENQRRVQHLGDAVRHLDHQCDELTHRANALRQEEITEEIEVLLLSGLTGHGVMRNWPVTSYRAGRAVTRAACDR